MAKLKKLPFLPGSEPEGSMAIYLAHALKEREMRQQSEMSSTAHLVDSTSDSYVDTQQTLFNMEHSEPLQTQIHSIAVVEITDSTSDAVISPLDPVDHMSKTLDTSREPGSLTTTGKTAQHGLTNEERLTDGLTTGAQPTRRLGSKSEPKTPSDLDLVSYLKALPPIYTSAIFTKREMQIRVSESMADLLRILNECSVRVGPPKYLADNLVNHLLQEFFVRYASDIDELIEENQQLQRTSRQEKLSSLKHKSTLISSANS